jgi:hypothetical protein
MTWWQTTKHHILEQHVVGVIAHSVPNKVFLYTVNNSVGGGGNLNIEALRRTLLHLHSSTPIPRTICINADHASDNKCWSVLLFLAMLVFHGYTREVYLSFLLVGHTHEDIDQLFSVLSRYLKKLGKVMGPHEFQTELANALHKQSGATIELMHTVLDWDSYLRPHLVHPAPSGIQHADLSGKSKMEKKAEKLAGIDPEAEDEVRVPHLFWIHRRSDDVVVLHYKELAAHSVFLPKMQGSDPAETNPEGIVLFRTPPPDPMTDAPPTEMQLKSVATV